MPKNIEINEDDFEITIDEDQLNEMDYDKKKKMSEMKDKMKEDEMDYDKKKKMSEMKDKMKEDEMDYDEEDLSNDKKKKMSEMKKMKEMKAKKAKMKEDDDMDYEEDMEDDDDEEDMDEMKKMKEMKAKKAKMKEDISIDAEDYTLVSDDVDTEDHISSIFNEDHDLSEDFKSKVTTIFKNAIILESNKKIKEVVSDINEKYSNSVENVLEQFEDRFDSYKSLYEEEITEKLDGWTQHILEDWHETNKVNIEENFRDTICRKIVEDIRDVYTTSDVSIPEGSEDLVEALTETVGEFEEKVNTLTEESIRLKRENTKLRRNSIVENLSEGLSDIQSEKFSMLVENISDDEFESRAKEIRTAYFDKELVAENFDTDQDELEIITEENETPKHKTLGSSYAEMIKKTMRS